MNVSEKIKAINNKIEQNKGQYNLDRHIWMISALLSGNVSKYWFLIGKDNSPEKYLVEKAAVVENVVTWCNQKKKKKKNSNSNKIFKLIKNCRTFLHLKD